MNGDYHISDVKVLSLGVFDLEHSSRRTGHTVCGLYVDDDGTFKLPSYLGLTPKGCTRDPEICHDSADLVIALETRDGEWFWMHISDYSNKPISDPKHEDSDDRVVEEFCSETSQPGTGRATTNNN